jgi:hypothetical protein
MSVGQGCDPKVGKRDEANLGRPPTNIRNHHQDDNHRNRKWVDKGFFLKFSSFMKQGAEAMLIATQRYIYLEYMSGYPFTHEA